MYHVKSSLHVQHRYHALAGGQPGMGERSRLRPQQGAGARGGAGAGSLVMAALTLALVGLVLGLALVPWSRDTAAPPPDTPPDTPLAPPPATPPDTVAACGDNEDCARVAEVMDTRHGRTTL